MLNAEQRAGSSASAFEIDNTNKHYEPRSYLKRFALDDSSDRIWVYDKANPADGPRLTHVGKVSVSKDAYTTRDDKHFTEVLEPGFKETLDFICSYVEDNGDFQIKGDADRLAWMAALLSVTQLRCSGRRSVSHPVIQGIYQEAVRAEKAFWVETEKCFPSIFECLDDALSKLGASRQDLMDAAANISGVNNRREWVAKALDPVGKSEFNAQARRTLEAGSWRFYRTHEGRSFITSDIPAVQVQLGPDPEYRNYWGWWMPLSKRVCVSVLAGNAADPEDNYPDAGLHSADKGVDLFNSLIFSHAFRFVYSADKSELIRAANDNENDWMPVSEERLSHELSKLREGHRVVLEECLSMFAEETAGISTPSDQNAGFSAGPMTF